jgi:hypothetical protein
MEVIGKLRVPAAMLPGTKPPVPIGCETEWTPEPVGMWRRTLKCVSCSCRESNLGRPVRTLVAILTEFTPASVNTTIGLKPPEILFGP